MSGMFFPLKRKSEGKTRAQTLVTESSPLKYIFYQLHCIMGIFYRRKRRSELRWLSPGFFGVCSSGYKGLWLQALEKWICQYCQCISAKITLTIWNFYVHHNSPSILEFNFMLSFFDVSFGNSIYFLVLV